MDSLIGPMQQFIRYRQILTSAADPVLAVAAQGTVPPDSILIGSAAAALLLKDDPVLYPKLAAGLKHLGSLALRSQGGHMMPRLTDAAGGHRSAYYPFVVHLHLAAFDNRYEQLPESIGGACEDAIPDSLQPLRAVEDYSDHPPPPHCVDLVLWQALAIVEQAHLLQRDIDSEWVDGVVHQVLSLSNPHGSLLPDPPGSKSAIEDQTAWLDQERCALHALANLALITRNRSWSQRVEHAAVCLSGVLNKLGESQRMMPPWALFAFAWPEKTRTMADQMLVAASGEGAPVSNVLAAMLFADAVAAMASFNK